MLLFSEMDNDERYNRKFRAGLYTLQWVLASQHWGGDLKRSRGADQGNQSHAISIYPHSALLYFLHIYNLVFE